MNNNMDERKKSDLSDDLKQMNIASQLYKRIQGVMSDEKAWQDIEAKKVCDEMATSKNEIENLPDNKESILSLVSKNGLMLEYAQKYQDDVDVVLAAVRQNGLALRYASENKRGDMKVVFEAIKQNKKSIVFASNYLYSSDITKIALDLIDVKKSEDLDKIYKNEEIHKSFLKELDSNITRLSKKVRYLELRLSYYEEHFGLVDDEVISAWQNEDKEENVELNTRSM